MPVSGNAGVTLSDQSLGSFSSTWGADTFIGGLYVYSGLNTSPQSDGYLLLKTRGAADQDVVSRLRVDSTVSSLCDFTVESGKKFSQGSTTIVDADGCVPYSVLKGVPSTVPWASLQGVPTSIISTGSSATLGDSIVTSLTASGNINTSTAYQISGTTVISSERVVSGASYSVGGTSVIDAGRNFIDVGNFAQASGKTFSVGGTTYLDSLGDGHLGTVFLRTDTNARSSGGALSPLSKPTYLNFHPEVGSGDFARIINDSPSVDQFNLVLELGDNGDEKFMVRHLAMSGAGVVGQQYDTLTCTLGRVGVNNTAPAYALDVTGSINTTVAYQVSGTTVVDSGRNLVNIVSVSTEAISCSSTGNFTGALVCVGLASAGDVNVTGAHGYQIGGSTVLDASKNLVGVGTVGCGAITTVGGLGVTGQGTFSGVLSSSGLSASGNVNVAGLYGYQVGGTTVIDSSRNLTNIGTVGCGAITTTGAFTSTVTGAKKLVLADDTSTNRGIVLWKGIYNDEHQFYGMGVNSNVFRFQVNSPTTDFVFYAGASTTTSTELFRVMGTGVLKSLGTQILDASRNLSNIGTVGCGAITSSGAATLSNTAGLKKLQFANDAVSNRHIVLYEGANNEHQYFGLGCNSGVFRFQVANSTSDFVFYAGASTTTSTELFRVTGAGILQLGGTTFMDASRNLSNIGTVGCGAITQSDNMTISTGKTLTVGATTIINAQGQIPYTVLTGTPSSVTWASLTGIPSTILYSDQTAVSATITNLTQGTVTTSSAHNTQGTGTYQVQGTTVIDASRNLTTDNVTISTGKTLTVGATTIIDASGKIPYTVLTGTPSAVTWDSLTGVPATIMYSDQTTASATITALTQGTVDCGAITISTGNTLTVGGTTIIDADGLIPYSTLKGSPSAVTWGSLTGVPSTILYSDQTAASATITALTQGSVTVSAAHNTQGTGTYQVLGTTFADAACNLIVNGVLAQATVKCPALLLTSGQGTEAVYCGNTSVWDPKGVLCKAGLSGRTGVSSRLRCTQGTTNSILFENQSAVLAEVTGDTGKLMAYGAMYPGTPLGMNANVPIGGTNCGIHLDNSNNYGIYVSAQGNGGLSMGGAGACVSLDSRWAHCLRFRMPSTTINAFIWENTSETCLMSLTADTGALFCKAAVTGVGIVQQGAGNFNTQGTGTYKIGGVTVIDASKNLTNVGTVGCGAITQSDNMTISTGKTISVGGTTIVDETAKVDWAVLKNTPYLYNPITLDALPATANILLGDLTFDWAADVVSLQAFSGADTVNKDEGYLLVNTCWAGDQVPQPRLRIDNTIQPYCSIVPVSTVQSADLGQATTGFRNAYLTGALAVTGVASITTTNATPLSLTTQAPGGSVPMLKLLAPSMGSGNGVPIMLGTADTTNDSAIIQFYKVGTGQASNHLVMQFTGSQGGLALYPGGNTEVAGNLTANSLIQRYSTTCGTNTAGSSFAAMVQGGTVGTLEMGVAGGTAAYSTQAGANDAIIRCAGTASMYLQAGSGAAAMRIDAANNITMYNQLTVNGTLSTPNFSVSTGITPTNSSYGFYTAAGPTSYTPQGTYIAWNYASGNGETDFINNRGNGALTSSGFSFYQCKVGVADMVKLAQLDGNGDLTTVGDVIGFGTLQDASLKREVQDMEPVLAKLQALRPVRFTWNERCPNPGRRGTRDLGLVAQEVQAQLPDIVRVDKEELLQVRYEKLIPYMLKAIQELTEEVKQLKARLDEE